MKHEHGHGGLRRRSTRGGLAAAIAVILGGASVAAMAQDEEGVAELGDITVTDDPRRMLPTEPSSSSFGFSRPLLETPRSVSMISEESIDLFSLSAVEDLVRVVPGVYTTTRFGIQGAIDIRNVSADTYFRGMKRVNLQGHGRSVLAAMDTIEVVKGPPSPIYGMGKIGGYTNMYPKSGRATTGAYLLEPQGFVQGIVGSYSRTEASLGVGGPMSLGDRQGGYYVYGLLEDSGSFARDIPVGQKLVQAATSFDNAVGPFRAELGINFQRSTTAGTLLNRFNQDIVDTGRYVRGTPLVNLDVNGNGKIGYLEMHQASPVQGNISAANQPLIQRWAWPTDENGNYLPLGQFPVVEGIPQSMYDFLEANPEHDPDGLLRAQGVGGPLPVSGFVPAGFALDPLTVGYDTLDMRNAGAFERELQADFLIGFFDLVYDIDPDFTVRNQLFFDSMDQYKWSEQPGGGKQDVWVIENKFTVTRRLNGLPDWMQANSLASVNYRQTTASGYRYGGDFSSHRSDVMARGTGGLRDGGLNEPGAMTPNATFVHPFENPDLQNDGAPWTSDYRSQFSEMGLGVLFDVDLFSNTNVLFGGRFDYSKARNVERAGTFAQLAGTSDNPGEFRPADQRASGSDTGTSWSISVTQGLGYNLNPYFTLAESSLMLDTNNNRMPNAVIDNGHIGKARLIETGIKGALLDDSMYFSLARYEQTRINVSEDDDGSILGAEVSSTITQGWEAELRWAPTDNLFLSAYGLRQRTTFDPNRGANILVDARTLGFQDVVDADGNVVFPAEAFLHGGRAQVILPGDIEGFERRGGNPQHQFGLNATLQLDNGVGFTFSGNHFSSVCTGRLCLVELPSHQVFNAGVYTDIGPWHLKLDVMNLLDERYFRARSGDTLADALAQAMPGRHWRATVRARF